MKILLTLLATLFFSISYSQEFTTIPQFLKGKEHKSGKYRGGRIVYAGNDGIIMFRNSRNTVEHIKYIEKFSPDLNSIKNTEFSLWRDKHEHKLENVITFQDKIYIFSSDVNTWLTRKDLFIQTLNKETLEAEDLKLFRSEEHVKSYLPNYFFALSDDRSKLMVCSYRNHYRKKRIILNVEVYGKDMKLLWQRDEDVMYQNNNTTLLSFKVDNIGNAFFLINLYEHRLLNMNTSIKNEFGMLCFNTKGEKAIMVKANLGDKYIREPYIAPDNFGNISLVGLFSEKYASNLSKGVFLTTFNPSLRSVISNTKHEFDIKLREKLTPKWPVMEDPEIFGYQLDTVIYRSDNSLLLIFEQRYADTYYSWERNNIAPPGYRKRYENNRVEHLKWHFDKLLFVKIDYEGNIIWTREIDKDQTQDDKYNRPSHKIFAQQETDKVYIYYYKYPSKSGSGIYADHDQPKGLFKRRLPSLYFTEIGLDGSLSTERLFTAIKKHPLPFHALSYDDNISTITMFGNHPYSNNNYQLFKLTLNEAIRGSENN